MSLSRKIKIIVFLLMVLWPCWLAYNDKEDIKKIVPEKQVNASASIKKTESELPDLSPELESLPIIEKVETVECVELGAEYWRSYIENLKGTTPEEREWLLNIATCESKLHNCAKNGRSSASGLFQYLQSTFRNASMAEQEPNIWDGHLQTKLALAAYRGGKRSAWVCDSIIYE